MPKFRKRLNKKKSRRNFKRGLGSNKKNSASYNMRGGIRL